MGNGYPRRRAERDRWILQRRPQRNRLDPAKPYAWLLEREADGMGGLASCATIFLTNRECPWRCVFCDLWKNTLQKPVPPGAIPAQIDFALSHLWNSTNNECAEKDSPIQWIKLYNSGSFFDPKAIPEEDYPAIAERLDGFDRVVVESHPALVGRRCLHFRGLISGQLEIALGLETANPEALRLLNKRVTLEQFQKTSKFVTSNGMSLRVFLLVNPPFVQPKDAARWIRESIDCSFHYGASTVALIPTRESNGAMEALQESGQFLPPQLWDLETALDYGVTRKHGLVIADLWDLKKFSKCPHCFEDRKARLEKINQTQSLIPLVSCPHCQVG